jgi:general stress protein 26
MPGPKLHACKKQDRALSMSYITADEKAQFFNDVDQYARTATWCALATETGGEPRVRMVHPTWEGETLWLATGPETLKAIHLMVRGRATLIMDDAVREHVWNNVMDYDLAQFWPDGPTDTNYTAVRIDPVRVELSEMFGTLNKRVWRVGK